eukprot:1142228-Pelagomonas_calceolata.AAC.1
MRTRSASSRPDAILITSHNAQATSNTVTSSCSHHALRSRHNTTQRTGTANRVRQPHKLHENQSHVHLVEIKYCEDTGPQHQLDAAKQQHADLCKYISAKAVTIHPIILGVRGTCHIERTLNQFKKLDLDHQRAIKLAKTLHAHFVQYAQKLVATRRAIQNKSTSNSQALDPSASRNPPDPH